MTKIKTSILGAGWLGTPLAVKLLESGYDVHTSTTKTEKINILSQMGFLTHLINLNDDTSNDFFDTDILFINIPAGIRKDKGENHKHHISNVLQLVTSRIKKIIYISSTSIYDGDGLKTEGEANTNHPLYTTEKMIACYGIPYTIIRPGGLFGIDRPIVNILSKKSLISNGNEAVNMIFKDDIVDICFKVITENHTSQIFNACAPIHPIKEVFYTHIAKKKGLTLPPFEDSEKKGKTISSQKIIRSGFVFKYPDPMDFPV